MMNTPHFGAQYFCVIHISQPHGLNCVILCTEYLSQLLMIHWFLFGWQPHSRQCILFHKNHSLVRLKFSKTSHAPWAASFHINKNCLSICLFQVFNCTLILCAKAERVFVFSCVPFTHFLLLHCYKIMWLFRAGEFRINQFFLLDIIWSAGRPIHTALTLNILQIVCEQIVFGSIGKAIIHVYLSTTRRHRNLKCLLVRIRLMNGKSYLNKIHYK